MEKNYVQNFVKNLLFSSLVFISLFSLFPAHAKRNSHYSPPRTYAIFVEVDETGKSHVIDKRDITHLHFTDLGKQKKLIDTQTQTDEIETTQTPEEQLKKISIQLLHNLKDLGINSAKCTYLSCYLFIAKGVPRFLKLVDQCGRYITIAIDNTGKALDIANDMANDKLPLAWSAGDHACSTVGRGWSALRNKIRTIGW